MDRFVCAHCGQAGASYCPTVEESSESALTGYYHPQCLARKNNEEGLQELTSLRSAYKLRAAYHKLSHGNPGLPAIQRFTVFPVRLPVGRRFHPIPRTL